MRNECGEKGIFYCLLKNFFTLFFLSNLINLRWIHFPYFVLDLEQYFNIAKTSDPRVVDRFRKGSWSNEGFLTKITDNLLSKKYIVECDNCKKSVYSQGLKLHKKYYCLNKPNLSLKWTFTGAYSRCLKCGKQINPNLVEFHALFLCGKSSVKCFFCTKKFIAYNPKCPRLSLRHHLIKVHKLSESDLDELINKALQSGSENYSETDE